MFQLLKPDFDLKKHPDLAPAKLNDLAKVAVRALSSAWPEVSFFFVAAELQ